MALGDGPLLALETSGSRGSAALRTGSGEVVEAILAKGAGHGARILPAVHALLQECRIGPRHLEGVVLGSGPGSFTGLRVAAAAGLGLARAARIPLLAVSSLAAAVLPDFDVGSTGTLVVLFDARGERLFAAAYRWRAGELVEVMAPRFARLTDVVQGTLPLAGGGDPGPVHLAGSGARRHAEALEAAGRRVVGPPLGDPSARGCLALAARAPGFVEPWEPGDEPTYLRATSVQRGG